MSAVELHHAFRWDCDGCGAENFFRAVQGDIDEAAMAADEDQVTGALVAPGMSETDATPPDRLESEVLIQTILLAPRRVICQSCGAAFEAEIVTRDD